MSRTFTMPELAESVVEGEIVKWLVAEGEPVQEDQPLLEVMTDKVTVEIPSPLEGVLEAHLAAEGDVVRVGAPLARFAGGGAEAAHDAGPVEAPGGGPSAATADATGPDPGGGERARGVEAPPEDDDEDASLTLFTAGSTVDDGPLPQVRKPTRDAPPAPASAAGPPTGGTGPAAARGPYGRPLAVPAARRRARELGVSLNELSGSGPHGRIRVADVEEGATHVGVDAGANGGGVRTALRPVPDGPEETREPLRGLRRVIAKQMMASHLGTVRTLHADEADMTALVALRQRLKPWAEARGVRLTYLPFVLRAVTLALAAHPTLNAELDDERDEVVRYRDVHLSLAVSTERGLMVPVIRDASRRSVLDLASEANRLAEAARQGTLGAEEVRGGTFSVTNIGAIGGTFSFPIIHAPQTAILGVHAIKKRPVVLPDDTIAPRSMTYLSLSFDHRLVDGAEAASFTNRLIASLETPEALLLDG